MACCINLLEMRYIIEEAETSRAHPKAEKLNHILGLQKTAQLQKGAGEIDGETRSNGGEFVRAGSITL